MVKQEGMEEEKPEVVKQEKQDEPEKKLGISLRRRFSSAFSWF